MDFTLNAKTRNHEDSAKKLRKDVSKIQQQLELI